MIGGGRETEAEAVLRGAMVIADRLGEPMAMLRARNNLLGPLDAVSVDAALAVIREVYTKRYAAIAAARIEANIPERERESLVRALRSRPAGSDPLSVVEVFR